MKDNQDVNTSQPALERATSDGSATSNAPSPFSTTGSRERHTEPRLLPPDFEPNENHLVIGRGKKTQDHSGNQVSTAKASI